MRILDGLFFRPTHRAYASPRQFGLAYEEVRFSAGDGPTLHGWFFPSRTNVSSTVLEPEKVADASMARLSSGLTDAAQAVGTIVHFHGNAGNITSHFPQVAWLPAFGWNVLCFDYRGYGRSEGRPSRDGLVRDGHAAIDYVRSRPDVDPARIVVFGQSLGAAVAVVVVAAREDVAGLVCDGGFSHYRRVVAWHIRRNPLLRVVAFWIPWLMDDGYDPIDSVARVAPTPLLILHGTADDVVDPAMAWELYQAAGEPKELWMIEGAGHYEALGTRADEWRPRLLAFVTKCVGPVPARGGRTER